MKNEKTISVMFVCLGNICRSPAAEEILRQKSEQNNLDLHIESCGMSAWAEGQTPHPSMQRAALTRGYKLISKAQGFNPQFIDKFDYILAADHRILEAIRKQASDNNRQEKVHLITHYSSKFTDQDVPDPFDQGPHMYNMVLDILEDSCDGLLKHLSINKRN